MSIPTEPIGSIPRPESLIRAATAAGGVGPKLDELCEQAVRDTLERFEATGSPVVTDGEQWKHHNFWTYSVHGLGCGFARFCDDASTSRDKAFAKIRARVLGTRLAASALGVSS